MTFRRCAAPGPVRSRRRVVAWSGIVALLLLAGCLPVPTVAPTAELPRPEFAFPLERVRHEPLDLPGFDEPTTPDAYDRALAIRFFAPADEAFPGGPRAIIVLAPGIFRGAMAFDHLARQLVASHPELEVWAVDRRANLLEDRDAMRRALVDGDVDAAYRYYVRPAPDAEAFAPIPPDELDFVRAWGLEVHLRDLHVLVRAAGERAERVFLGGHSLSGAIVGDYAAFLFDDPAQPGLAPRAGQEFLDGLILIDGGLGRTGGFGLEGPLGLGPFEVEPDLERFLAGEGTPYFTAGGYAPSHHAREGVLNLLAFVAPDAPAPPEAARFPVSNEVGFGLRMSTAYGLISQFGATLGEARNVRTTGNALAFVVSGRQAAGNVTVVSPAGDAPVTWERGDAPTAIAPYARGWSYPEADPSEWYFPARLALDVVATDVALREREEFIPTAEVDVPTLIVGAGRGLVSRPEEVAAYRRERAGFDVSTTIVPGYTHADILQAERNPVAALMGRWIRSQTRSRR